MRDNVGKTSEDPMRDRIAHHVTTLRVVSVGLATMMMLLAGLFWAWRSARRRPSFQSVEGR